MRFFRLWNGPLKIQSRAKNAQFNQNTSCTIWGKIFLCSTFIGLFIKLVGNWHEILMIWCPASLLHCLAVAKPDTAYFLAADCFCQEVSSITACGDPPILPMKNRSGTNASFKNRSSESHLKKTIYCYSYALQLIFFWNVLFHLIDFWNTWFHLVDFSMEGSRCCPRIGKVKGFVRLSARPADKWWNMILKCNIWIVLYLLLQNILKSTILVRHLPY